MKDLSTRSTMAPQGDSEGPTYLTTSPRQENMLMGWWYRLASPVMPGNSATYKEMEQFRRGRAGSNIILALYLLLLISIPASFVGTDIYLVPIVIISALALVAATVLNRMGYVYIAGTIVTLAFIAFPVVNIVTTPGGLSILVLPLYGLLVLSLLCVVSFLPPWLVFVVALVNSLFTLLSLLPSLPSALSNIIPRTAELNAVLAISAVGIILPIILSQILVSVVAYAWVQGNTQSTQRADRAEELAKLEHDLALQAEAAAQQKQLLEASIQKIVETHMRVANGDFSARVPLTQDNVLWQISGSLNNLLARLQSFRQDALELQRLRAALHQAREENGRLMRALGRGVN
ncbi:MAG TPA: hypothetical protein VFB12_16840 [Ktedonobacteraceae bacterium]|nr:hypothetical protein [Ktedonobacteraceae bacterium]